MRVAAWLRSAPVRRRVAVAAVLTGCFVWAMVVVGLSFAMVEHGGAHWWVIPLFGVCMPVIAVLAIRRLPVPGPRPDTVPEGRQEPVAADDAPSAVVRRTPVEQLSSRELEVLRELAAGRSNAEIARALFVAPGTVKAHLNHIFRKLEAASRLQAVAHAREAGLLE